MASWLDRPSCTLAPLACSLHFECSPDLRTNTYCWLIPSNVGSCTEHDAQRTHPSVQNMCQVQLPRGPSRLSLSCWTCHVLTQDVHHTCNSFHRRTFGMFGTQHLPSFHPHPFGDRFVEADGRRGVCGYLVSSRRLNEKLQMATRPELYCSVLFLDYSMKNGPRSKLARVQKSLIFVEDTNKNPPCQT